MPHPSLVPRLFLCGRGTFEKRGCGHTNLYPAADTAPLLQEWCDAADFFQSQSVAVDNPKDQVSTYVAQFPGSLVPGPAHFGWGLETRLVPGFPWFPPVVRTWCISLGTRPLKVREGLGTRLYRCAARRCSAVRMRCAELRRLHHACMHVQPSLSSSLSQAAKRGVGLSGNL